MEALIERWKRARPKGRVCPRAKRVDRQPLLLKPNETQHSKELTVTQLRSVSNKSPFVRTGFQPKQARQSPDLQYSMVAWRGFLSALRATRPLRLKPSGEFLKTAQWAVFLTEFHLIGSNPHNMTKKTKTGQAIAWPATFDGSLEGIRTPDLRLERAAS